MTTTSPAEQLRPVTMEEAVGYPSIACTHETLSEHTVVLKHDRLFLLVDPARRHLAPRHLLAWPLPGRHPDPEPLPASRRRGPSRAAVGPDAAPATAALIDLAVNDLPFGGNAWDPRNVIHVRRELSLSDRLIERLTLTSYLRTPLDYWVELEFGADFADIFEVRGWRREARGQFFAPLLEDDCLTFAYRGRDGRVLRSVLRFRDPPAPGGLTQRSARWASAAPRRGAGRAGVGGVGRGGERAARRAAAGAGRRRLAARRRLPGLAGARESLDHRCPGSRPSDPPGHRRSPGAARGGGRRARALRRASRGTPPSSAATRSSPRCRRCRSTPGWPGARCATCAARQGRARGPLHRGAAGEDPPRDPSGRDGSRRRDPPRPLLRKRGRHAPVARPAARDLALDRGRRAEPRAPAPRGARAGVDRPVRRSRRRRLRGVPLHLEEGTGQPGVEGLG